jgi:hypothetical protein
MKGFWRIPTSKPPRPVSSTRHRYIRFTSTNSAISSTSTNTGRNTSPKAQGRTPYSSLSVASKTNPVSVEQDIFRDRSKGTIHPNHKVNQDFNQDGTSVWAMGLSSTLLTAFVSLRFNNTSAALPKADRQGRTTGGQSPNSYHTDTAGFT